MTVSIVWQYMPVKALLLPLTAPSLVGPALESDFTPGTFFKAENSLSMIVSMLMFINELTQKINASWNAYFYEELSIVEPV